ncbi:phytanoyl-CoA dioxygenase family protein [Novosphingobium flavum]|uniref:phytanoyl-CoA dioxygenase family protein n=1 Tax=Novosphingobium aerophilum TaxID=2839843 RepID=UPI001639A255|nr:phytanoyl-CoA dioxygenase family protein [Novosphingobium aerophilum]MBC2661982.1 phytanoyl-CoA dioxygenase family protein [Novosphingobium aerophilum]
MSRLAQLTPGVPLIESLTFRSLLPEMGLSEDEQRIATDLNQRGYAVIDFPDPEIDARIERIKAVLSGRFGIDPADPDSVGRRGGQRIQDAWTFDQDVKAIATNPTVLDLLGRLYGRRAVPFQTLNFPVGTQQHIHSDSIHFSSVPERFMCGVWLAMEDIHEDAGPLTYCPGSHRWPIVSNLMLGTKRFGDQSQMAQAPYEEVWRATIEAQVAHTEVFLARKGQALIWAANLLHGGSPQRDPNRTRWSQVTHYYFADCAYYTPAFSDEAFGRLDLRRIVNIATGEVEPNRVLGEPLGPVTSAPARRRPIWRKWLRRTAVPAAETVPADFDDVAYLRLNPDVAAAQIDAREHYLKYGREEGRTYR